MSPASLPEQRASRADDPRIRRRSTPRRRAAALAALGSLALLVGCSSDSATSRSNENPALSTTTGVTERATTTSASRIYLPLPPSTTTTEPVKVGNYTLDGYSSAPATLDAQTTALDYRNKVLAAVRQNGWTSPAALTRAGFVSLPLDPEHWVNMDFVRDGVLFDPNRPEFFVVMNGQVLGVMFLAPKIGYDIPATPGEPFIRWHRHLWSAPVCLTDGLVLASEPVSGKCPAGEVATRISPAMFHVWFGDVEDPFTADMSGHHHHG